MIFQVKLTSRQNILRTYFLLCTSGIWLTPANHAESITYANMHTQNLHLHCHASIQSHGNLVFWWPVRFWVGSSCIKSQHYHRKWSVHVCVCRHRHAIPKVHVCMTCECLYVWLACKTQYVSATYIHACFAHEPAVWIAGIFRILWRRRGSIAGTITCILFSACKIFCLQWQNTVVHRLRLQ